MVLLNSQELPLIIDLDGTLIKTDSLHESLLELIKTSPSCLLLLPYWLWRGKAYFKEQVSSRSQINPELFPHNKEFLAWLREERSRGRYLVLCTAANKKIAESISEKLNIFDEVISSDENINMAGNVKAEYLNKRFGSKKYDYAGNSKVDLKVWRYSNTGIVIAKRQNLIKSARMVTDISRVFIVRKNSFYEYIRLLRVHQWLKNLLIFVPIIAAHDLSSFGKWIALITAFISFSFCASFVYILNDLFDIENDRSHPKKKERPFANGNISIPMGILTALCMLSVSIITAQNLSNEFKVCLLIYFLVTCFYTIIIKKIVIIDCLVLAFLYTLRIISGVVIVGEPLSFWLLAFSLFLFLSLAFVKRYAELVLTMNKADRMVIGRGYATSDAPLVQIMGIAAGYISVLILALYLNSEAVLKLYRAPQVIWFGVCIILFWISWVWMQAHRGKMNEDPLIFAIKDRVSLISGALFIIILILGTLGL